MAEDGFPLPGSSYKELSKIIAGYSEIAGPSAPADVGKLVGIHETQVSRSNKFLVAIKIIEGGQKKTCTNLGTKLGRAIHFEQTDEIASCWRSVVQDADFLQKIISSIRIRRGMEESALASHIAFTSGNSKSGNSMAGAGAIIEILRIAEAIKADGGTLLATDSVSPSAKSEDTQVEGLIHLPKPPEEKIKRQANSDNDEFRTHSTSFTNLNISLNISCTPADLDGLGAKLRQLQQEFEGHIEIDVNLAGEEQVTSRDEEHDQTDLGDEGSI
ncbi:hypothetical protein [Granulicella arctica]|uniref:Uncharacterized protein n=1 Tax=Granulicella arctica TaxID=940613 RepID=A0A7Y9TFY1_9BACT|nr:hypothetical protein [Granulicella arctica]NYF79286.1 hypothetical protein [Granulicella arctica]